MGVLQACSNKGTEHLELLALIEKIQARTPKTPMGRPFPLRFPQLKTNQAEAMAADYQTGMRVKELAVKYGISRETVIKHLRRQAVTPRSVGLDEQQIKEVVRLYEQGDSLATIGKRMGATAHTVRSRLIDTHTSVG